MALVQRSHVVKRVGFVGVVLVLAAGVMWAVIAQRDGGGPTVAGAGGGRDCALDGREDWPNYSPELLMDLERAYEGDTNVADDVAEYANFLRLEESLNKVRAVVTGREPEDEEGDLFDVNPQYAGAWLDSGRGKAVIAVVIGSAIDENELFALMPNGADDLDIEYVAYSWSQLGDWFRRIGDRLRANGIGFQSGIKQIRNRIDITVPVGTVLDLSDLAPADAYCIHESDVAFPATCPTPASATVANVNDSVPRDTEPAPEQTEPPGTPVFNLYVSNQSFEDDAVRLTITIDAVIVTDQVFDVQDQHNWLDFPLDLALGEHELTGVSGTGAELTETFTIAGSEPMWVVLDYWYYPGENECPYISFEMGYGEITFG